MNNGIPEVLSSNQELSIQDIKNLIVSLPNRPPVMIDKDLAKIYQVETKVLNQAVKRNPKRFPPDFMFQATKEEVEILRSQIVTSKYFQGVTAYLPYFFTREGANQISSVLQSDIAIERSIQIMRAFSQMEEKKVEQPDQLPPSTSNDTYYLTTFHNPTVIMHIKKKDCSDKFQRFVDFGAGVMFPVQPDNSIQMSEHQYNKMLDIIGMELKTMVNYGFTRCSSF